MNTNQFINYFENALDFDEQLFDSYEDFDQKVELIREEIFGSESLRFIPALNSFQSL